MPGALLHLVGLITACLHVLQGLQNRGLAKNWREEGERGRRGSERGRSSLGSPAPTPTRSRARLSQGSAVHDRLGGLWCIQFCLVLVRLRRRLSKCSRICSRVSWASLLLELLRLQEVARPESELEGSGTPSPPRHPEAAPEGPAPGRRAKRGRGHPGPCSSRPPGVTPSQADSGPGSYLCLLRGRLLFLMSRDLMCSASSSSCFMHQCRRMLVVNWSSGWHGLLSTIFTISSLGLGAREGWGGCSGTPALSCLLIPQTSALRLHPHLQLPALTPSPSSLWAQECWFRPCLAEPGHRRDSAVSVGAAGTCWGSGSPSLPHLAQDSQEMGQGSQRTERYSAREGTGEGLASHSPQPAHFLKDIPYHL